MSDNHTSHRTDVIGLVRRWAAENEVELESVSDTQAVVILPGEKKLKTNVSIRSGVHAVEFQAFVVRKPDENRERFFEWLLQQNSRIGGLSFSVDGYDDVYLNASLPPEVFAGEHAEDVLDSYLGRFLAIADKSFNELLVLGFLTSMKREWAWRLARGESTKNLSAFEHLVAGEDNEFIGTFTDTTGESGEGAPGGASVPGGEGAPGGAGVPGGDDQSGAKGARS